jgi:hypothetical protein
VSRSVRPTARPTLRLPLPLARRRSDPAAATDRIPRVDSAWRPPVLTPAQERLARVLEDWLDGRATTERVCRVLDLPPAQLQPLLAEMRDAAQPWLEWSQRTCEQDWVHDLCHLCRNKRDEWFGVRDGYIHRIEGMRP